MCQILISDTLWNWFNILTPDTNSLQIFNVSCRVGDKNLNGQTMFKKITFNHVIRSVPIVVGTSTSNNACNESDSEIYSILIYNEVTIYIICNN